MKISPEELGKVAKWCTENSSRVITAIQISFSLLGFKMSLCKGDDNLPLLKVDEPKNKQHLALPLAPLFLRLATCPPEVGIECIFDEKLQCLTYAKYKIAHEVGLFVAFTTVCILDSDMFESFEDSCTSGPKAEEVNDKTEISGRLKDLRKGRFGRYSQN